MIWKNLLSLIRAILYGWAIALWELVKLICDWWKKQRHEEQPPPKSGCVPIDHPAFVRPDPLIYSQQYLLAQGLAVTWDNPDIELLKGGIAVSSANLEPSTTYEVRARIWNNSLEAPVVNMPVHLRFHDFGIGPDPIAIGDTSVDVGVKGSASQPGFAQWLWTTPPSPGHYCLQVLLDPVDDLNPANNLGQENTNVVAAHSPAVFNFKLANKSRRALRYHFDVDAYEIPALTKCRDTKTDGNAGLRNHRQGQFPVPNGFAVQIDPATPTLDPDESILITVTVDPPASFSGRQPINVNAISEQGFEGGVTLTCVKET